MAAWGKFEKSSGRIHRLEHHCADVAACFEALLRDPVLRMRFVKAAGDHEFTDTTAARLTFLAYLHDFGKLNAGFMTKRSDTSRIRIRTISSGPEAGRPNCCSVC